MVNFVISLIINSLGTMIMYLVGVLILRIGAKKRYQAPFMEYYALMRGLIVFTYVLLIGTAIAFFCLDEFSGYIFLLIHSGRVWKGLRIIFLIWLAGVLFGVIRLALQFNNAKRFTRELRRATEEEIDDIRAAVSLTGVKRAPTVCFGDGVRSAFTYGVIKPLIAMPENIPSGTDRQIVLAHELIHYKSKDLSYRYLGMTLQLIFWFHPVLGKLIENLTEWDELHCDELLLRTGITNAVGYARVLYTEGERIQSQKQNNQVYPKLLETKKQWLLKRIEIMLKRNHDCKTNRRLIGIVLGSMLVFGCSTSVIAGVLLNRANDWDLQVANPGVREEYIPETHDEIIITAEEAESLGLGGFDEDEEIEALPYGPISCTIANAKWSTGYFSATSSQAISVNIISANPSTLSYNMGIIEPNGTWRYLSGSGAMNYTFYLTQTGSYKVFLQNTTSTSLSLSGSYFTADMN